MTPWGTDSPCWKVKAIMLKWQLPPEMFFHQQIIINLRISSHSRTYLYFFNSLLSRSVFFLQAAFREQTTRLMFSSAFLVCEKWKKQQWETHEKQFPAKKKWVFLKLSNLIPDAEMSGCGIMLATLSKETATLPCLVTAQRERGQRSEVLPVLVW